MWNCCVCIDDVWQSTIDFVRVFLRICSEAFVSCTTYWIQEAWKSLSRQIRERERERTDFRYIWRICVCVSKQIIVWFEATIVCKAVNWILAIQQHWMKTTIYAHILKLINHVFMSSLFFLTCTDYTNRLKPEAKIKLKILRNKEFARAICLMIHFLSVFYLKFSTHMLWQHGIVTVGEVKYLYTVQIVDLGRRR